MNLSKQKRLDDVPEKRLHIIRECARTGGVYVRYYRMDGEEFFSMPVYENTIDKGIEEKLQELWPERSQSLLLEHFMDDGIEDVIVSSLEEPLLQAAMCIRDSEAKICGVIVLMGINREGNDAAAYEKMGLRLSDEEHLSDVIRLIADVLSYHEEVNRRSEEMEGTLRTAQEANTKDRELLERNSVMTEILAELESDEEFLHVTEQCLAWLPAI